MKTSRWGPPEERCLQNLRQDRVFRKLLPSQQIERLYDCIRYGMEQARKVKNHYGLLEGEMSLEKILREWGVTVERITADWHLPYLGEYMGKKRKITLYLARIGEVSEALKRIYPQVFERYSLSTLCLAHEMFHHLEQSELGSNGGVLRLEQKLWGPFHYRHRVEEGSEIAAHTFVQVLFELPISTYDFSSDISQAYDRKENFK